MISAVPLWLALVASAGRAQEPVPIHVRTFYREYVNCNEVRARTFAFPAASIAVRQVTLTITLECPTGGCDHRDRGATVFVKGTDDSGAVDVADAISILSHLVANAGPLPSPFGECGVDPTADGLDCSSFPPCDGP